MSSVEASEEKKEFALVEKESLSSASDSVDPQSQRLDTLQISVTSIRRIVIFTTVLTSLTTLALLIWLKPLPQTKTRELCSPKTLASSPRAQRMD